MSEQRSVAVVAAMCANLGVAAAKFIAFAVTGSAAMLAEGLHSVADTSNQALLMLGQERSRKAPTQMHPFGYGPERYFWAFLVAVLLFTGGSMFSLYEGYQKVVAPHTLGNLRWAFGVLVVAMVFEGFSLRTAVREANAERTGSWWRYIRGTRTPETAVVLLEDTAAETGLLVALVGLGLAVVTGNPVFDAFASIGIGLVLGVVAVILAVEMKSLLIGESARQEDLDVIREVASSHSRFEELLDLRTMHLGPNDLLVAMKVELDDALHSDEVAYAIDEIKARIQDRIPAARAVYIEAEERAQGEPVADTEESRRAPFGSDE
ncbi:MAG: cation diffusion facilitator family transporter [Actinomycetota bacterium]|nr:cation diffusion facilitator family transporter [Actinomycetota bacterium]